MPIESWFSTPIYIEQVPDADALIASCLPELQRIYAGRPNTQRMVTGDARSGSNAETSAHYLFLYPALKPLFAMINERATAFAQQLNLDLSREHLYLGRSWANLLKTGGRVQPHNHMASVFSGVFYLQVPQPDSVLRFVDPREPLRRDPRYVGRTPFNVPWVDYRVRQGMLMLFPGYLNHGMLTPNLAEGERVSVSFDYYSVSLSGQSAPPPPRSLVDKLWRELEADVAKD
jgi:uncharacterized protein (TIGR02466 family)